MTGERGARPGGAAEQPPRPADDLEPQRHLGYLLRRAQQVHVATWARLASADTTSVQYAILAVLERRGEVSQRELGDDVDLDRSTIADLVARMQRRGLIARRRSAADARRNTVTLTDAGRAELHRLRPEVLGVQEALAADLSTAEVAELRRLLRRLLTDPEAHA